ncbi:centromere protein C [Pelobates fuscus]|uniref:centromere protein C n=1 Tax=Pelobates fuscus TaxID=191477 RepID=UPI002FE4700B
MSTGASLTRFKRSYRSRYCPNKGSGGLPDLQPGQNVLSAIKKYFDNQGSDSDSQLSDLCNTLSPASETSSEHSTTLKQLSRPRVVQSLQTATDFQTSQSSARSKNTPNQKIKSPAASGRSIGKSLPRPKYYESTSDSENDEEECSSVKSGAILLPPLNITVDTPALVEHPVGFRDQYYRIDRSAVQTPASPTVRLPANKRLSFKNAATVKYVDTTLPETRDKNSLNPPNNGTNNSAVSTRTPGLGLSTIVPGYPSANVQVEEDEFLINAEDSCVLDTWVGLTDTNQRKEQESKRKTPSAKLISQTFTGESKVNRKSQVPLKALFNDGLQQYNSPLKSVNKENVTTEDTPLTATRAYQRGKAEATLTPQKVQSIPKDLGSLNRNTIGNTPQKSGQVTLLEGSRKDYAGSANNEVGKYVNSQSPLVTSEKIFKSLGRASGSTTKSNITRKASTDTHSPYKTQRPDKTLENVQVSPYVKTIQTSEKPNNLANSNLVKRPVSSMFLQAASVAHPDSRLPLVVPDPLAVPFTHEDVEDEDFEDEDFMINELSNSTKTYISIPRFGKPSQSSKSKSVPKITELSPAEEHISQDKSWNRISQGADNSSQRPNIEEINVTYSLEVDGISLSTSDKPSTKEDDPSDMNSDRGSLGREDHMQSDDSDHENSISETGQKNSANLISKKKKGKPIQNSQQKKALSKKVSPTLDKYCDKKKKIQKNDTEIPQKRSETNTEALHNNTSRRSCRTKKACDDWWVVKSPVSLDNSYLQQTTASGHPENESHSASKEAVKKKSRKEKQRFTSPVLCENNYPSDSRTSVEAVENLSPKLSLRKRKVSDNNVQNNEAHAVPKKRPKSILKANSKIKESKDIEENHSEIEDVLSVGEECIINRKKRSHVSTLHRSIMTGEQHQSVKNIRKSLAAFGVAYGKSPHANKTVQNALNESDTESANCPREAFLNTPTKNRNLVSSLRTPVPHSEHLLDDSLPKSICQESLSNENEDSQTENSSTANESPAIKRTVEFESSKKKQISPDHSDDPESTNEDVEHNVNQKIVLPSHTPNVRRSRRTKVKPLQYWRGERANYLPRKSGGFVIDGIIPAQDNEDSKKPANKKQNKNKGGLMIDGIKPAQDKEKRKQTANKKQNKNKGEEEYISKPTDMQPLGPTVVLDPVTGTEINMECVKTGEDCHHSDSPQKISFCKSFRNQIFSTGKLIVGPLQEKGYQFVCLHTMLFHIIKGDVEVTIHVTSYHLKSGDSFFVPPGNLYNIKNVLNEEAMLIFTQIKGPSMLEDSDSDLDSE